MNDPFQKTGSHEKTITPVKSALEIKEGAFNVHTKNKIISAHDQPFCVAI